MGRKVSERERKFIDFYVQDLNGTKAARLAGYTSNPGTQAYELLKKPHIFQQIQEILDKKSYECDVSASRVRKELAAIAFANIGDYCEWNEHGVRPISSDKIKRDKLACISEVIEHTNGAGTTVRFKMYDKNKALETLCKLQGYLLNEKEKEEMSPMIIAFEGSNTEYRVVNEAKEETPEETTGVKSEI